MQQSPHPALLNTYQTKKGFRFPLSEGTATLQNDYSNVLK